MVRGCVAGVVLGLVGFCGSALVLFVSLGHPNVAKWAYLPLPMLVPGLVLAFAAEAILGNAGSGHGVLVLVVIAPLLNGVVWGSVVAAWVWAKARSVVLGWVVVALVAAYWAYLLGIAVLDWTRK